MLSWSAPQVEPPVRISDPPSDSVAPLGRLRISSSFGWRTDPLTGARRHHDGIDLPAPAGARALATAAGVVRIAGWVRGYGNMIEIEHENGVRTRYGHLASVRVAAGDHVRRGQAIGDVGSTGRSTGNHLHYEVRVSGIAVDPLRYVGGPGPREETVWAAEVHATPRWNWAEAIDGADTLPEARIR